MTPGTKSDAALLELAGIRYQFYNDENRDDDGLPRCPTTNCDDAFWLAERCCMALSINHYYRGNNKGFGATCYDRELSHSSATADTPALACCLAIEAALKARQPVDPMTLPAGEELDKAVCEAVGLLKGQHPSTDYSDVFDAAYESGICGNLSVTLWLCRQILAFKKGQRGQ